MNSKVLDTFILPYPYFSSHPLGPRSSLPLINSSFTSSGLKLGFMLSISAISPATWGAASEVPFPSSP